MILGVTPARGRSKGMPRKNIRPLCGKPLLAWTVEAAQQARLLDRYVVSTEDEEIALVAKEWGAEVLWRPDHLADDTVPTVEVLHHVLEVIPATTVVLLQATSPIRNNGLIDQCISQFQATQTDSLATGFICRYREYGTALRPRQEIQGFFYDDGNVYVIRASLILEHMDRFGQRREHMLSDREQSIDIDEEFDLWLAELVLTKRRNLAVRPSGG